MPDDPPSFPRLRPATEQEVVEALSFALRFDGRRPFAPASSLMARITAEHLARHLRRCGFAGQAPGRDCAHDEPSRPSSGSTGVAQAGRAMMAMAAYAELQVTTNYSFLRGASHPEELFAAAAVLGLPALGVVDSNSVAGIVRCWEAAKATGVRLVAGCRVDLTCGTAVLLYPTAYPAWSRVARRST